MQKLYELSKKDEALEFGDPLPIDEDMSVSDENGVSGLGVEDEGLSDEEMAMGLAEMLNDINSGADKGLAAEMEKEAEERERYRLEEEKRLKEIQDKYNKERYEKEQALKAERLKKEAEERAKEEEEERKQKENTFFGKLGKAFKKKDKVKTPDVIKEDTAVKEVAENKPENKPEIKVSEEITPDPEERTYDFDLAEEERDTEVTGNILPENDFTPQSEAIDIPEERDNEPKKAEKAEKTVPKPVKEHKEKKDIFAAFKAKKPDKKPVPVQEEAVSVSMDEPDWKFIATHDDMTGMLNSRAYHEELKKNNKNVAVIFFDINNLKYVNDNFSHNDGDILIKNCSEAIMRRFGKDRIYRIGGDEFVAILPKEKKNMEDKINEMSANVHKDLTNCFKESEKHVPHAVSIGYAIGDGKTDLTDIIKVADAAMYRNKKAYKQAHPDLDMRRPKDNRDTAVKTKEIDHDDLLSKDQKNLKDKIQKKHTTPSAMSTRELVREIQKRKGDVHAILVASPTFDHLFVIQDVNDFINLVLEQEAVIDYSYLYVVWDGGSQYFGADEYYNEVTDIFKEIAEGLVSGRFRSEKDIRSIKGINIFRNVYV